MVSVPPQMPTTWPWWHGELAPRAATLRSKIIASGCSTSGGNVQCAPEAMRADAALKARATKASAEARKPAAVAKAQATRKARIAAREGAAT